MTYENFVFWLKGYLEVRDQLLTEDVSLIKEKLKDTYPPNSSGNLTYPFAIPVTTNPITSPTITYGPYCGFSGASGGSAT